MIYEMSTNIAEVIPYKTFKEKNRIIAAELKKDRYIETWDKLIYSAKKWKVKKKKGDFNETRKLG